MKKTSFKFMIANRSTVALAMVVALAFSAMMPVVADTKSKTTRALTGEQKIVHLLNRTGFGVRAGDVELVRAMGIEKYLDQQLHPERINDSATEARLKRLESEMNRALSAGGCSVQPSVVVKKKAPITIH